MQRLLEAQLGYLAGVSLTVLVAEFTHFPPSPPTVAANLGRHRALAVSLDSPFPCLQKWPSVLRPAPPLPNPLDFLHPAPALSFRPHYLASGLW